MQATTAQVSDHVLIYLSVLYGAAVAAMMAGSGRLLRNRDRVRRPTLTILWSLIFYLQISQNWWPLWTWADYMSADFLRYFLIGLTPTLFCLGTAVLYPTRIPEKGIDLREFFLRNRFAFLGCTLALQGVGVANGLLLADAPADSGFMVLVRALAVAVLVLLLVSRRPVVHLVGASALLAGTVGWALLFTWSYR